MVSAVVYVGEGGWRDTAQRYRTRVDMQTLNRVADSNVSFDLPCNPVATKQMASTVETRSHGRPQRTP